MRLTNRLNYPPAYIEAANHHIYQPKPDRIGVTALITSPQTRRLVIEKWDDLVLDIEDFFTPMVGISFHNYLEKNCPEGYTAEQKWEYLINGLTLVGKADIVDGGIEDYKLMSGWSWTFSKDEDWAEQLNCLNWLRFKNGGEHQKDIAKYLRVHAFIKDWSKYQAERSSNYPQKRYFCIEIPIWPIEKTERFINRRIALHKDKNYQCSDEDKWIKIEKFAVMQHGRKSALRLLDTFADAEKYILDNGITQKYTTNKIYIEQRKSEPKKCLDFCTARSVCPFALGLNR